MIHGNPPPRGAKLSAAYLKNQHENLRANKILRSDDYSVRETTRGTSIAINARAGGGILIGVIVEELTARTGSYPTFTYGSGVVEILNPSGIGVSRTVAAYNTFRDPIPVSTEPAIFGEDEDGKIYYINSDC